MAAANWPCPFVCFFLITLSLTLFSYRTTWINTISSLRWSSECCFFWLFIFLHKSVLECLHQHYHYYFTSLDCIVILFCSILQKRSQEVILQPNFHRPHLNRPTPLPIHRTMNRQRQNPRWRPPVNCLHLIRNFASALFLHYIIQFKQIVYFVYYSTVFT